MRWLLHGNLPAAVKEALVRHGHIAGTPIELQIEASDPDELLKQANARQLDVITTDANLANAPFERGVRFGRSIVLLQHSTADVEPQLDETAIDRLFERYKRLSPRRLYTVTATRVKVRQLPG